MHEQEEETIEENILINENYGFLLNSLVKSAQLREANIYPLFRIIFPHSAQFFSALRSFKWEIFGKSTGKGNRL